MARIVNENLKYRLDIVLNAEEYLVLISPYIDDRILWEVRYSKSSCSVIKVFCLNPDNCGSNFSDKQRDVIFELEKYPYVEVYYDSIDGYQKPKFHAKCYFNEKQMLITSQNYSSQEDRFELGVLIDRIEDSELYNSALKEINRLCYAYKFKPVKPGTEFDLSLKGYCINCGCDILFDVDKPYCYDCYKKLDIRFQEREHQAQYCHKCGKYHQKYFGNTGIKLSQPLCKKCRELT